MLIPGNQQLILNAVIHHLDHKNVSHDPQIKYNVIQIATSLARQIRSGAFLSDIGFVSDLCRHLRKSLQATIEPIQDQELNLNSALQNAIEYCLLETIKGVIPCTQFFLFIYFIFLFFFSFLYFSSMLMFILFY